MICVERIGGFEYTAIVGRHEGTSNPDHVVSVTGPGLSAPAEYHRNPEVGEGAEQEGARAIRYTVDNIVLPMAMNRAV